MQIGETIPVFGEWFSLHFIENEGMAFGISFGQNSGKLMLSLIRIGVVGYLIYYLIRQIKNEHCDFMVVGILSLIITGALGNIIDSAFYGIAFDYAPFMYGRVVDMFYVKLFVMPDWIPIFGGSYFFPAIFNIADCCVTVGVIALICCNGRFFSKKETKPIENQENSNS